LGEAGVHYANFNHGDSSEGGRRLLVGGGGFDAHAGEPRSFQALHPDDGRPSRAGFAEQALDRLALGVASVDDRGFLFYTNQTADHLLERCDGLRVLLGRFTADEPVAAMSLHEAFAAAADRVDRTGRVVRVPRPSGAPAYLVTVVPLPAASPNDPSALALVRDDELGRAYLPAQLARLFGLTRAEAQLAAALAEGASLKEIADTRAVKISTVRTQAQMVLDKAGVSRQAEFVALVARLQRAAPPEER
jgi:DNA-binding CsgD family transcriptional regulator